mgnify:CR=1 FL=1|jgi:hypothetical protein
MNGMDMALGIGGGTSTQEEDLWSLNADVGPAGGYGTLDAAVWAHNLSGGEANPTINVTLTNTNTGEVVRDVTESLGLISPGGSRSLGTGLVTDLDPNAEYEVCGEIVEVERP